MPVTFDSLRSPYGTPFRRAANYAVSTAKKVTKNAVSLTTTGASHRVFCPAVSERLSPSGIGGTFLSCTYIRFYVEFFCLSKIVVLIFFPFERHAELNSKGRPLGTVFTCFKIKRSLLNLFVVASLCFEKSEESE
jgi:hypothetical protein